MKNHSISRKILILFTVILSVSAVLMLYALVSLFQKYNPADNEASVSDTPVNTEEFSYETLLTADEICAAAEAADVDIKSIDAVINKDGTIRFSWKESAFTTNEGYGWLLSYLPYAKLYCTVSLGHAVNNKIEAVITDASVAGFTADPSQFSYFSSYIADAVRQKIHSVENFTCEALSMSEEGIKLSGHLEDTDVSYNFTNTTDMVLTIKFLRNLEVLDTFNNVRPGSTITFNCELTEDVITCKCWHINAVVARTDLDPDIYMDGSSYDIVSYENSYGLSYTFEPAEEE